MSDLHCRHYVSECNRIMDNKNMLFHLLTRLGRNFFEVAEHSYPKGEPNSCYNNAWNLAMNHPELTYVEGYAMSVIPLPHAWCVNAQGEVVDTTWDKPATEYFGIPFKTSVVRENGLESGLPSMLDNYKSRYVYETPPIEFFQEIPK